MNREPRKVTAADVDTNDLVWWQSQGKMTRSRVASTTILNSLVGATITLEFTDGSGLNTRLDTTMWIHPE